MNNPQLSIIVPVYNAEKYLPRMLDSLRAQIYTSWECILVDDGSTDKSGTICDEYVIKDSRFRVLHKINAGPSAARNDGIKAARGEWITFIDADDEVLPNFLYDFSFDKELDYEIQGFKLCYIQSPEKDRSVTPFETRISSVKEVYGESELNKLSRGPYCKLFKKKILNYYNIEFPEGIHFAEDAIFVKRYLTHCSGLARAISAADYLYYHYPSSNSLTNKRHPGEMMYNVAKMDFDLFMELEQKWGRMSEEVRNDFIRIRTLEFYNSICLFLTEKHQSFKDCVNFLKMVKYGLFQKVKDTPKIPITYRIIKLLLTLPSAIAVAFLKLFFTIKKPKV